MANDNLRYAPQPKMVDGMLAVPIDIQIINAALIFDGATSAGSGDATIDFIMGSQNGNPIFDLRQTITAAWLDGVSIPVSKLNHHDFGGGIGAELRIVESSLAANSSHSLRVTYSLGIPQASNAGGYQPHLLWSLGPRLTFNFGFTDLGAGRFLEAWVPANLIYDQFDLDLQIQLLNTMVGHTVISNGTVTAIGTNHWSISFPGRFTALSPLLEVRATDTLISETDNVVLPVSGNTVTIEAFKLATDSTNLTTQINNLKTFLTDNENDYGAYIHNNRFVVFFIAGGMEYEGGTTATTLSLDHETFHSWFARGLKPASQPDSWWDEAYTSYHVHGGASSSMAFAFTNPPKVLCTQNAWSRVTPSGIPAGNPDAYIDGERFWQGVSALTGNSNLRAWMKSLYNDRYASLISTTDIEEYLVSKSGSAQLVDGFHRFVYGFDDPTPVPDLWIKDDVSDPGEDYWGGTFWNSPDLWIRNNDDGGVTHQSPEYGQDNWFYARIRNRSSSAIAKHFLVSFNAKSFAGTQFTYPNDFLPCINAFSGFDLAAGSSTIVKARWPENDVPPSGTHSCMLAAVIARSAHPVSGKHVWEHNNLAQKNLTIVNLIAGDFIILPFVISNYWSGKSRKFRIELKKEKIFPIEGVGIIHQSSVFKLQRNINSIPLHEYFGLSNRKDVLLDCGGHLSTSTKNSNNVITSKNFEQFVLRNYDAVFSYLPNRKIPSLLTELKSNDQTLLALKVEIPKNAKTGSVYQFDVVQRDDRTNRIIGGIALEIHIKNKNKSNQLTLKKK